MINKEICRRGRTFRRRCRRRRNTRNDSDAVADEPFDRKIVRLMQWLKANGFHQRPVTLKVHDFPDTGRGLMSLKPFKPGELLVSVPENLLITTSTVLASNLGPFIQCFSVASPLSPVESICSFLIAERHKGRQSRWFPYIDVLPAVYSIPAYWTAEERLLLPASVYARAEEQLQAMHLSFKKLSSFFELLESKLPSICGALTYENFRWAWASVNTRCVYWEGPAHSELNREPDRCALVPFLDFFNHSPSAKIEAKFDKKDRSYKLQTLSRISKYSEAFINYGPHDNSKLVLEYGFTVPHNINDAVQFTIDDLISLSEIHQFNSALDAKKKFLNKYSLFSGLSCSAEGISWNLLAAARILASPSSEKDNLLKVYLDDKISSVTENGIHDDLLNTLLGSTLSAIHDVPLYLAGEMTYHRKLAFDLCLIYKKLLRQCLARLNIQS